MIFNMLYTIDRPANKGLIALVICERCRQSDEALIRTPLVHYAQTQI